MCHSHSFFNGLPMAFCAVGMKGGAFVRYGGAEWVLWRMRKKTVRDVIAAGGAAEHLE